MGDKTFVALASSTVPDYQFLAPLTALLWKQHIGFEPITFLVGPWETDAKAKVVLKVFSELGLLTHYVPNQIGDYSEATIAQNIRQHTASLGFIGHKDWVMTADADLWPIKREFYQQHVDTEFRLVSYYSNGDHFFGKKDVLTKFDAGGGFQSIPTCHVTMRVGDWRQIYDLVPDEPAHSLERTFEKMKPWLGRCQDKGLAVWCSDQWYVTERVCRQDWFPPGPTEPCPPGGRVIDTNHVRFIQRYGHPPVDRLDRCHTYWGKFHPTRWVDAHLHKTPYNPEHWEDEVQILDAYLPDYRDIVRRYWLDYVSA